MAIKKVATVFLIVSNILGITIGHLQSLNEFQSSREPVKDIPGLVQVLTNSNENPGSYLNTPQIIQRYGYPVESHKVITEDGYILTMHRIPFGKNEAFSLGDELYKKRRPVVFLQHGLFASSFEWFMNKPEKLLALRLADSGWDVWLGNSRGNAYSREHIYLKTNDWNFWQFSFHEMADKDIPAEIDYVLKTTGQPNLQFIGYSMGTTVFWAMTSLHPEYNEKVRLMIALAPVVFISNMDGFPRLFTPFYPLFKPILDLIGNGEFLPPWLTRLYNIVGTKLCSNTFIAESICQNINFLYAGWDLPQTDFNQVPLFYSHTPSPTATAVLAHISQLTNTGVFSQYDFGYRENLIRYGSPRPPEYNLRNSTAPIALIWGPNDSVVNPIDVRKLASELPNVVFNSPVNFTLWNHFDYHLGKEADVLVNDMVYKLLVHYLNH